MSTTEQPETPPLTRKQMREIRNTGATPVILPAEAAAAAAQHAQPESDAPAVTPPAQLARAAEPIVLPEPPGPDFEVDLGVSPLTRRQARQQERIRTASVPVITPEVAAAYTAAHQESETTDAESPADAEEPATPSPLEELGVLAVVEEPEAPEDSEPAAEEHADPVDEPDVVAELDEPAPTIDVVEESEPQAEHEPEPEPERATVNPGFGAALLAGDAAHSDLASSSFDDLITRSANGSGSAPSALILSQSPDVSPMMAPLTATGEVMITGTLNLPEGLGSLGHAPGVADGKEADAVLVDKELPAHSSPTPIAASAAISTVKQPGEIIKPPTPEKGGKLMMTLAITAGVLALALVGVLILAFATGVF
ncbi:hypothetical protein [Microbacterium sp. P5_E9]